MERIISFSAESSPLFQRFFQIYPIAGRMSKIKKKINENSTAEIAEYAEV
jgi:hypothetical protein